MIDSLAPVREPKSFLAELDDAFERAALAVGGSIDYFVRLAGRIVRLRFAGPALPPRLTPALAHLRVRPVRDPQLTVCLWDSQSTGTTMPRPPWSADDAREQGKVRGFFGHPLYAVLEGGRLLSVLDAERDRGLFWVRSAERIGSPDIGSPLRTLLHLWLQRQGVQLVHGAAVGSPRGCVLIAGNGGTGKSSSALACLPSELSLLGDDYCLLVPGDPPTVHSLYSSAKTNLDALERMPFLAPMVSNPNRSPGEKALYFLHRHEPHKLLQSAPLRALAVVRVSGARDTRTSPAPASAALLALAPSTLFQLPGADAGTLNVLAGAVRGTPCRYLDAGTDPEGIAAALGSLLAT